MVIAQHSFHGEKISVCLWPPCKLCIPSCTVGAAAALNVSSFGRCMVGGQSTGVEAEDGGLSQAACSAQSGQ